MLATTVILRLLKVWVKDIGIHLSTSEISIHSHHKWLRSHHELLIHFELTAPVLILHWLELHHLFLVFNFKIFNFILSYEFGWVLRRIRFVLTYFIGWQAWLNKHLRKIWINELVEGRHRVIHSKIPKILHLKLILPIKICLLSHLLFHFRSHLSFLRISFLVFSFIIIFLLLFIFALFDFPINLNIIILIFDLLTKRPKIHFYILI